jgi:hypothetical protein
MPDVPATVTSFVEARMVTESPIPVPEGSTAYVEITTAPLIEGCGVEISTRPRPVKDITYVSVAGS